MNALLLALSLARLKPFLTVLVLPPVPFLLSALWGIAISSGRRRLGAVVVTLSLALVWLGACTGAGEALESLALPVFRPMDAARIAVLRGEASGPVAIIVLGAGVEAWAPEYEASSLHFRSLERLRYGLWLGRQTGWPVGFSGGLGWSQPPGSAREAVVAQRIATGEFGMPLRWVEDRSRDTRENAELTAAVLRPSEVAHILLVTHSTHMPRALRNFQKACGPRVRIEPAPIGLAKENEWPLLRWLPTGEGMLLVRAVFREWLGSLSGA